MRDWDEIVRRHRAFWSCAEIERPLIYVIYHAYQDPEWVAAMLGEGEVRPERIDPTPILPEYDKIAHARNKIGDRDRVVAEFGTPCASHPADLDVPLVGEVELERTVSVPEQFRKADLHLSTSAPVRRMAVPTSLI